MWVKNLESLARENLRIVGQLSSDCARELVIGIVSIETKVGLYAHGSMNEIQDHIFQFFYKANMDLCELQKGKRGHYIHTFHPFPCWIH